MYREAVSIKPVKRRQTIFCVQSQVQTIRFDATDYGLALYLDDELQFVEKEERKYHHALSGIPILRCMHQRPSMLILGGGDGLAARTALSLNHRCSIITCEIDPIMIHLAYNFGPLANLNKHAFARSNVIIGDARDAVKMLPPSQYDIVICDFPDLKLDTMDLYGPEMYSDICRLLKKGGIISVYPGGHYHLVRDCLRQDYRDFKDTWVNLETMGTTPIISARRK